MKKSFKQVMPESTPDIVKIHGGKNYGWREHKSQIRFYEYERHVIWGIAARILQEFSRQINSTAASETDIK